MRVLDKHEDEPVGSTGRLVEAEAELWLHCVECGHPITRATARLSVAGAEAHVFMNPAGHVFEIGCFREAPGARSAGAPSDEWSWFPGYSWTTEVCARCLSHLGWRFDARSGADVFHGLIRDRIRESS